MRKSKVYILPGSIELSLTCLMFNSSGWLQPYKLLRSDFLCSNHCCFCQCWDSVSPYFKRLFPNKLGIMMCSGKWEYCISGTPIKDSKVPEAIAWSDLMNNLFFFLFFTCIWGWTISTERHFWAGLEENHGVETLLLQRRSGFIMFIISWNLSVFFKLSTAGCLQSETSSDLRRYWLLQKTIPTHNHQKLL